MSDWKNVGSEGIKFNVDKESNVVYFAVPLDHKHFKKSKSGKTNRITVGRPQYIDNKHKVNLTIFYYGDE